MTSILDKITSAQAVGTQFRPNSPVELFALRLAQHLRDAPAARHYVKLADQFSEAQLLSAYRRTMQSGVIGDLGRQFHRELQRVQENGSSGHNARLLTLRVERRAIAAAVFYGQRLDYTQLHQLSSAKDKALGSALSFLAWIIDQFSPHSTALELIGTGHQFQRELINQEIKRALRERMLSIWEVPRRQLLAGFGHPQLKSRKELRQVVTDMWPVMGSTNNGRGLIVDAVALGLFVQIERCFLN